MSREVLYHVDMKVASKDLLAASRRDDRHATLSAEEAWERLQRQFMEVAFTCITADTTVKCLEGAGKHVILRVTLEKP